MTVHSKRATQVLLLAAVTASLGAQQSDSRTAITMFGEVRSRTELERPVAGASLDAFTFLRSRFGLRADPSSDARIVLQLQDSRVLGTGPTTSPTGSDVLDVHQAYLEFASAGQKTITTTRIGRQEIALSNERLVGAVGWSNTGRTFDGACVNVSPTKSASFQITAFVAIVEELGRRFGGAAPGPGSPDHIVAGFYALRRVSTASAIETTWLFDGPGSYRTFDDARRLTIDARYKSSRTPLAPVGLELEGAFQFGTQHALSAVPGSSAMRQAVGAYLLSARVGRSNAAGWAANMGADYLSGDATPRDGRFSAFWTAYATNHPFYGTLDIIGDPATSTSDRGLFDILATISAPVQKALLVGELHRFSLASGVPKALGWEGDVALHRSVGALRIDAGVSAFAANVGASIVGLAPDGTTKLWSFLQVTLPFSRAN